MRLFLDTDILLDVLLEREAFVAESATVLDWAEAHPGQCGGLSALSDQSASTGEGGVI